MYMKYLVLIFFLVGSAALAQKTNRFQKEVDAIGQRYDTLWDSSRETIVFTGSSSVRIWKDLEQRFPGQQLVNSGFGGSQASDLLLYCNELILRFKPKKVFIYEGDNDIAAEKKSKEIIENTSAIIKKIRIQNPNTKIVLIAAKPSIARWELKRSYKKLNRSFKKLSKKDALIAYADVWTPMLDGRQVKQNIFLEDGLHMNKQGYDIWYSVLKDFVN